MAEEENSISLLSLGAPFGDVKGSGVRASPTRDHMVPGLFNGDNFDLRAEAAGFLRHDRANSVHSSFIGRWRLAFDQSFEQ
jgi:hypothetical protein